MIIPTAPVAPAIPIILPLSTKLLIIATIITINTTNTITLFVVFSRLLAGCLLSVGNYSSSNIIVLLNTCSTINILDRK